MKQCLVLLLTLCILLSCAACGAGEEAPPTFYYLRTDDTTRYGQADALVAPVTRELSWDVPLSEMLQLYLQGPGEDDYRSPVPMGTRLLRLTQDKDVLVLELSGEFSALDGIQLSLAGACLTATCHTLAGYEAIEVRSGANIYEFHLNDFVFLDTAAGE